MRSWEGDFSYVQHAHGWHSEDLRPRADGWRISGGFLVSRIDDRFTGGSATFTSRS